MRLTFDRRDFAGLGQLLEVAQVFNDGLLRAAVGQAGGGIAEEADLEVLDERDDGAATVATGVEFQAIFWPGRSSTISLSNSTRLPSTSSGLPITQWLTLPETGVTETTCSCQRGKEVCFFQRS
jgi:hypothetical protein